MPPLAGPLVRELIEVARHHGRLMDLLAADWRAAQVERPA